MSNKSRMRPPGEKRPSGEKLKITLPFGKHGELTEETIKKAALSSAEKSRAYEMMDVQAAFIDILDNLSYPVDPDGHVHDLNHMKPSVIAIAWTLALVGMRKTGPTRIKKRFFEGAGLYQDAHTWVDVRQPDDAQMELHPDDRSDDPNLPPDTRRLAALRDGEEAPVPEFWRSTAKVVHVKEPRAE